MDPQFNHTQYDQEYDQKHFIHIYKSNYFLLQDSGKIRESDQKSNQKPKKDEWKSVLL